MHFLHQYVNYNIKRKGEEFSSYSHSQSIICPYTDTLLERGAKSKGFSNNFEY